jgi:hypothetical protein
VGTDRDLSPEGRRAIEDVIAMTQVPFEQELMRVLVTGVGVTSIDIKSSHSYPPCSSST